MRKTIFQSVLALVLLASAMGLATGTLGSQDRLTLVPEELAGAGPGAELKISGVNHGDRPSVIVVRIDDANSHDYWSRLNIERSVPNGPFTFRLSLNGLRTPKGRLIDLDNLKKVLVFTAQNGERRVPTTVTAATIEPPRPLVSTQGSVLALDAGADKSPVFPGFTPLKADDPRLEGASIIPRVRSGGDSLVQDGLEGVETLTLHVGPGRWRVMLWMEDLGEWEYLPHALERRIRINGQTVFYRRLSAEAWTREIYLAGREQEWRPGQSAWDAIGARRGGLVSAEIDALDERLRIELAGSDRSATYLSGILVAPAAGHSVVTEIEARRRARFEETWRVAEPVTAADAPTSSTILSVAPSRLTAATAPGTPAVVTLSAQAPSGLSAPKVTWSPPTLEEDALPVWPLTGFWRLTRPDTAATLLVPDDRHLRGDGLDLPIPSGLPRRYVFVIPVPATARPGTYRSSILIEDIAVPLSIEVLDVDLPQADRHIGVYLEDLPTHRWFRTDPRTARGCAMRMLRNLGLTGIAPPLVTPREAGDRDLLEAELREVAAVGFEMPPLGYTPLKRLKGTTGWQNSLRASHDRLADKGMNLLWSAADEVSNHGGDLQALRAELQDIRRAAPAIRLAGHLNAERDMEIADAFDVVLVNSGFGLTRSRLEALKGKTSRVWLYNMGHPRLAAGAYLWRAGLDGYLQWHARMPTADPFDPTDGREADVMLLPPTPANCPPVPDLDRDLLAIAEGITDLRWLLWLDRQALRNATAKALQDAIRARIPVSWTRSKITLDQSLSEIREEIISLARRLR